MPSSFFLTFTEEIPCIGATVTPSVTTARPILTAMFSARSVSRNPCFPSAISSAILSAATSDLLWWRSSLNLSAMGNLRRRLTLSAISRDMSDSGMMDGSMPILFALELISY